MKTGQTSTRRKGFTLRELVAVVVVIGLLLAVLLPAMNDKRGPSRSGTCRNNLRNLVLSVIAFESVHNHYPGYHDSILHPDGRRLSRPMLYFILPQLERSDLYELYDAVNYPHDGMPDWQSAMHLLICPSAGVQNSAYRQPTNYLVNAGMPDSPSPDLPYDWPENGVFQNRAAATAYGVKLPNNNANYVERHDGLAATLLFAERLELCQWTDTAEEDVAFIWHPRYAEDPLAQVNSRPTSPRSALPKYSLARPSSGHPNSVQVAFCDGHVRPISDKIDYLVYAQLMTPHGAKAAYPGLTNGKRELVPEAFRSARLPEEFGP